MSQGPALRQDVLRFSATPRDEVSGTITNRRLRGGVPY